MQFSDLPNGGHNLRLYTYDPIGSTYGPKSACGVEPTNTWIYNTGHYDVSLGTPCSVPDPQGFCDSQTMDAYAGSRGETLVMVNRTDLTALCGYRPPIITTPSGGTTHQCPNCSGGFDIFPATTPCPSYACASGIVVGNKTSPPMSGGITTSSITTINQPVPGYVPSPGTPVEAGGLPGGVGTPTAAVNPTLSQVYRFILYDPSSDPNNPYATGASYPGCSQVNTVNCLAKSFRTQQDAVNYALANGEIPYLVHSAAEPWEIINGTIPLDPSRILGQGSNMNWLEIAAVGLGLWFLSGR